MRNFLSMIWLSLLLFWVSGGSSFAEKVVLEGASCQYSAHVAKKVCSATETLQQQKIALSAKGLVWSPSLLELEAFRLQNEAYRAGLEKARQASEERRLSAKILFTPAYLKEMEQYQKGMSLYFLRNRKYQHILGRLVQKKIVKKVRRKPRKKTASVREVAGNEMNAAIDSQFPPFPTF